MFQVGKNVRYGQEGVCRIDRIGTMDFCGEKQDYYVLEPLFKPGALLYVPVKNSVLVGKMRPLLTIEEVEAVICDVLERKAEWVRDFRLRSNIAKKALASDDRADALYLIKNILFHKKENEKEGKKVHTTDDCFLKDAENLIYFEFSVVLNQDYEQIANQIRRKLENSF